MRHIFLGTVTAINPIRGYMPECHAVSVAVEEHGNVPFTVPFHFSTDDTRHISAMFGEHSAVRITVEAPTSDADRFHAADGNTRSRSLSVGATLFMLKNVLLTLDDPKYDHTGIVNLLREFAKHPDVLAATEYNTESSRADTAVHPAVVVDSLLALYGAHARGEPGAIDAFLDDFERWLTPDGIAMVDALFERIDLGLAPEPIGILLLAMTRLTRTQFGQREAFAKRLGRWLLGRSGRTQQDVDSMLRGLLE